MTCSSSLPVDSARYFAYTESSCHDTATQHAYNNICTGTIHARRTHHPRSSQVARYMYCCRLYSTESTSHKTSLQLRISAAGATPPCCLARSGTLQTSSAVRVTASRCGWQLTSLGSLPLNCDSADVLQQTLGCRHSMFRWEGQNTPSKTLPCFAPDSCVLCCCSLLLHSQLLLLLHDLTHTLCHIQIQPSSWVLTLQ